MLSLGNCADEALTARSAVTTLGATRRSGGDQGVDGVDSIGRWVGGGPLRAEMRSSSTPKGRTERLTMSVDEAVTKDLVETLEDGREGFAKGAEKLDESDSSELAATFRKLSEQRAKFSADLRALAGSYGDDADESGSVAAKLHRGWLSLKDALNGSSPLGVLEAAEQGEDHAEKEYEKALGADISPDLRELVQRQSAEVKAAHGQVRSMCDSHR